MQRTLSSKSEILSFLESTLRSDQFAEVALSHDQLSARIYVAKGAVAWALASGQSESFQTILINEHNFSKEQLIRTVRESRESGKKSFDELLSALGIHSEADRREVSRRHTSAALRTVLAWGRCSAEVSRRAESMHLNGSGFSLKELLNEAERSAAPVLKLPTSRPTALPERLKPQNLTPARDFQDVDSVLRHLSEEIPLFRAAMVIDLKTGTPIASVSESEAMDIEAASAFYRDVVRSAAGSYAATGKEGDVVEEILISGSADTLLLKKIPTGDQVLLIVLEQDGNAGMARILAKRNIDALAALLS